MTDGRTKPASLDNLVHRVNRFGKQGWKRIRHSGKTIYKGTKRTIKDTFGTPTVKDEYYYRQKADKASYKAQLKAEKAGIYGGIDYDRSYDDVGQL